MTISEKATFTFTLNGHPTSVQAAPGVRFLWVLRDILGLTGTKYGCGMHECRACTALLDGVPFASCSVPVDDVAGHQVTTIEGLADGDKLSPVQEAWLEVDVPQCGYCQAGQIMCATGLLAANPKPTDADIDQILNICRCGTYGRIREAIKLASEKIGKGA